MNSACFCLYNFKNI